jgi:hypothetical protein
MPQVRSTNFRNPFTTNTIRQAQDFARYPLLHHRTIIHRRKCWESTFPGLPAGKQEVGIFYCTWHSRKALQRDLQSYGKGCDLMLQAMYKVTRMGCEQLVQEAINKLPLEQNKNYVRRNWVNNMEKWAMYSRQHSPLLLQMTSTSPLESHHAV